MLGSASVRINSAEQTFRLSAVVVLMHPVAIYTTHPSSTPRYALQPRLVVPVALAAGQWYYNTQLSGQLGLPPLTLADQCGLLAGFLTCKAVFWVQVYEENKPKFDPEEVRRAKRPTLVDVEDVSEDLRDMLKKKTASDKDVGGQEGGDAKPAA